MAGPLKLPAIVAALMLAVKGLAIRLVALLDIETNL